MQLSNNENIFDLRRVCASLSLSLQLSTPCLTSKIKVRSILYSVDMLELGLNGNNVIEET